MKDYGAVGDGKADDTAPIQAALKDLQKVVYGAKGVPSVLYIPAGTYRITSTLKFAGTEIGLPFAVTIVGEDPAATKIVWDGPAGGTMLFYNATYSSLSRLTFDGGKKAGRIIENGPKFSVSNDYSDLVFQDAGVCLELGKINGGEGITDGIVTRSTFLRCTVAGVVISNWNSLMWGISHSLFQDNYVAVTNGNFTVPDFAHPPAPPFDPPLDLYLPGNKQGDLNLLSGAGNFLVYQNVFINSTLSDVYTGNALFFGIRDNLSLSSNAFYTSTGMTSPSQITLQRNVILDPTGKTGTWCGSDPAPTICLGNAGPLILLDNTIRSLEGEKFSGRVVKQTGDIPNGGMVLSVGNTYTRKDWFSQVKKETKFRSITDKVVDRTTISDVTPSLPKTPPKLTVPIFEVPPGSNGAVVQKAIDDASKLSGKRPVVHLPPGSYPISKTLVIPAGSDVQMVGDGFYNPGVTLEWTGKGEGPVLRIDGPTKARLRGLAVVAKKGADGILVNGVDQPGDRVRTLQVFPMNSKNNISVDRIRNATVEFLGTAVSNNDPHWVPGEGAVGYKIRDSGTGKSPVLIMGEGGSIPEVTYDVENSSVLVRDVWTESRSWLSPRFVRLKGKTDFTLHNFFQAHPRRSEEENAAFLVDGIEGRASFIGGIIHAEHVKKGWEIPNDPIDQAAAQAAIDVDEPEIDSVPSLVVRGANPATKAALIGADGFGANYFKNASSSKDVGEVYTYWMNPAKDPATIVPRSDGGRTDDPFLLEMLQQTRSGGPVSDAPAPGPSDLSLFRVSVFDGRNGILLVPTHCGNGKVESGETCDDGNHVTEACPYGPTGPCQVCNAQCQTAEAAPTYCGDKVCDINHESTSSCSQDCGPACLMEGLVSWWPGEGNADDRIGDNDGELRGAVSFEAGFVGQAFRLPSNQDNIPDLVDMGKDGSLDRGTDDFTVAFWAKASGNGTVLWKGCPNCQDGVGYQALIGDGGSTSYFLIHGSGDQKSAGGGFNPNANLTQWHHYAGVFDRQKGLLSMYFDGQLAKTADIADQKGSVDNPQPFQLGPATNASVDEPALWRRALKAQEVKVLYEAGGKGMCWP